MKLVLIENEAGGSLNHLGVEVETSSEVEAKTRRLVSEKSTTEDELGVECCYARRDKVWARDPDGAEWEWPTVLGDSEVMVDGTNCC